MKIYTGKGVYGAVAIGRVSVFNRERIKVEKKSVVDSDAEIKRYLDAVVRATAELREIYDRAVRETGEENAQIFEIHMMMLEDADFNEAITDMIGDGVNAEYAVEQTAKTFAQTFSSMDDEYMRGRAADIFDIAARLITLLSGGESKKMSQGRAIICADDLAPSETVTLGREHVLAFVTAHGSSSSHTAILARNMNVPAIIGVGEGFLSETADGMLAVVDGYTGKLYLEPDEATLDAYTKKLDEDRHMQEELEKLIGEDNVTKDGKRVEIYANIGGVSDVEEVLSSDAGGIGLFRSEFLYLGRDSFPTEDDQFAAYKSVLEKMGGKKVIIRTLDIGADKQVGYFGIEREDNPALGYRAIRICLDRPDIFKTQLRALYRASKYGKLGIMFPMITSESEVERIKAICDEVKRELTEQGVEYSDNIELGIMIETPAAAVISDRLAPLVDFFSVGTNDLIQYTLACDRQNSAVERFCDTHHEAVLKLIELSAKNAHKHGKWIGICGELAADTALTKIFLKMGINELSVVPGAVLRLRARVRELDLTK